jgi:hypothetical protein
MKVITRSLGLSLMVLLAVSCATSQSRFIRLGQAFPPRPEGSEVQVFRDTAPDRPFVKMARLDVHLEKTFFIKSSLEDALPALKKQARTAGADAIIEIQERFSTVAETKVYHVTAMGIRFTETNEQKP